MTDRLTNVQILYGNRSAGCIYHGSGRKAFIHDNEIEGTEFRRLVVDALDSCDDDGFFRLPGFQPRGIDSDFHFGVEFADFVGVLFEKFLDVGENEDAPVPSFNGIFGNLCQDKTFPCRSGKHDARVVVVFAEIIINRVHRLLLIVTQFHFFIHFYLLCT